MITASPPFLWLGRVLSRSPPTTLDAMNMRDQYLEAATRDNTRQSYGSAIRHFEVEWGGFLPATADSISHYLAHYAPTLSVHTLRHRLAALARWHNEQGFPDPTKAPIVRQVLRGIAALHPVQQKQARPLQLDLIEQVALWLDGAIAQADRTGDRGAALRHRRDKALLLLGFWRGFRGDELTRLRIEHVQAIAGEGMTCYLTHTKADRTYRGSTFKVPALARLCPVEAYLDWTGAAHLDEGPVFRAIDRWAHVRQHALRTDSLIPILRAMLANAGIASARLYSGHSLRRGFAAWATSNGWDMKTLMEYVGWKNVQSAMRYVDAAEPFAAQRLQVGVKK
ncbi:tyrosine-type recombinase/integrase [Noviherbaspirillum sp.]|uniref:tyrosine-type recombinase/integrase n=1 Tax=Noviherbaspirillum sp. TaxID=1926288 RepID=UPI002FE1F527